MTNGRAFVTPVPDTGRGMNRLALLRDAGVSIWLDTLSRELLDSGAFATLVADYSVTGVTSNPSIFAQAIRGSDRYDDQLRAAVATGLRDPRELFFQLALDDVRSAADLVRPAYAASGADDRHGIARADAVARDAAGERLQRSRASRRPPDADHPATRRRGIG